MNDYTAHLHQSCTSGVGRWKGMCEKPSGICSWPKRGRHGLLRCCSTRLLACSQNLPWPTSIEEVQKFVNQNAHAAAGNFVSAVGNFSKMLSKGSLPQTSTKRTGEGARVSMSSVKQVGIFVFSFYDLTGCFSCLDALWGKLSGSHRLFPPAILSRHSLWSASCKDQRWWTDSSWVHEPALKILKGGEHQFNTYIDILD